MPQGYPALRVAAAQILLGADINDNVSHILRAMEQCVQQGTQVLVCPETAVSGYSPTIGRGREPQEWPLIQEGLRAIARGARDLGIWVAVGSEAWEAEHWWNRFYAYGPDGQQAAVYDKVHLTGDDTRYYTPGSSYPVFQIEGITVGLQICYDARFPEGYRALLSQRAKVILQGFYGAGSGTWKVPVLGAHLRSRAAESGCFVVASNVAESTTDRSLANRGSTGTGAGPGQPGLRRSGIGDIAAAARRGERNSQGLFHAL